MASFTRETYEANDIEVIADKLGKLWLNERHVEKKLDIKIYLDLQTSILKNIKNKNLN